MFEQCVVRRRILWESAYKSGRRSERLWLAERKHPTKGSFWEQNNTNGIYSEAPVVDVRRGQLQISSARQVKQASGRQITLPEA